jgi:hypothetical protein
VPRKHRRGLWDMACWNGLSHSQQDRLLRVGTLPFGYEPEGACPNGAEVGIETDQDETPAPRFYCRSCAIAYLVGQLRTMRTAEGGW